MSFVPGISLKVGVGNNVWIYILYSAITKFVVKENVSSLWGSAVALQYIAGAAKACMWIHKGVKLTPFKKDLQRRNIFVRDLHSWVHRMIVDTNRFLFHQISPLLSENVRIASINTPTMNFQFCKQSSNYQKNLPNSKHVNKMTCWPSFGLERWFARSCIRRSDQIQWLAFHCIFPLTSRTLVPIGFHR